MNMREALIAALRRDPELVPKITGSLRERMDDEGAMARVASAAEALEPILADAVQKRPSRLAKLGLKSTHLLAGLATADATSNRKLERIAAGSTVGILFADVADFMSFTAIEGDEAASKLLRKLESIVENAAVVGKGEIVKCLGDGFLLAFPSASQAVRSATVLRDGVARDRLGRPVRIAVHAGEPLIEQDDLLGHDVNLTARLLDHCSPGEIVVSEAAKELAEKRLRTVSFGRRTPVKVRGLTMKIPIYSVLPPRQRPRPSS